MGSKVILRVVNETRGNVLAEKAGVARSFGRRLKGLLFRRGLLPGEGLIIEPCNAVHTFFMLFPIDTVFYDFSGRVVAVFPHLAPFCCTPFVREARGVIELPAGKVAATGTQPGDRLSFLPACPERSGT